MSDLLTITAGEATIEKASAPPQSVTTLTPEFLNEAIAIACNRIAPLWPLKTFVAVNPFLGFAGQSFADTCAMFRRIAGVNMLMPRDYYLEKIANGFISDDDLLAALAKVPAELSPPPDVGALRRLLELGDAPLVKPRAVVATVAEVLDRLASGDRHASRTAFMVDEISKWCAAYFDEGQAAWKLPSRNLKPYPAWREAMKYDRNPEAMGIQGFRDAVTAMPEDPQAAIAAVIEALGIPDRAVPDYLHRALFDIGGWSGYVRHLAWNSALYGQEDDRLVHLLAIRVVWGYALFCERRDTAFQAAWASAMAAAATLPDANHSPEDPALAVDLALQLAYEIAYQRRLIGQISAKATGQAPEAGKRKAVQAAFCIDVRSEVYRRALETVTSEVETVGFAGFFGFPIEYIPIGQESGGAQCPVLLKPAFTVCESIAGASPLEESEILSLRLLRRRASKAWKAFKLSAVSTFTYVETTGLLFAPKILGDSLGLSRPVPHPLVDGLDESVAKRAGPRLDPGVVGGRNTGFTAEQRIAMAEAVLRAMSMTSDFARIVLLAGHGSTTVNNPHASGLDCGACGGHTGEANARVAAGILNDPDVRAGLSERGIVIPEDTWFVAALHDTTTDEVHLFDTALAPKQTKPAIEDLRGWLAKASHLARLERSPVLNIHAGNSIDNQVIARSRDWSQVRPEWGLAGNAAFIAAPRSRTQGLALEGRAFLHSYDWREDKGFGVLQLIMTAPMVVASWINLQYYGSTVNNRAFGSGNKVLHNVVGTLGVLEGNAGDLKAGLPWQSVHDGKRFIHEPLRLNVFIEAPLPAIDQVISSNDGVRDLVENGWVHLFAIAEDGKIWKHAGNGQWGPQA